MKTIYCYMCGNDVSEDNLIVWKHEDMDGGRPFETCPICASIAVMKNRENDYMTSFALSRCFTPMKKED